jgi:hypothetical protein
MTNMVTGQNLRFMSDRKWTSLTAEIIHKYIYSLFKDVFQYLRPYSADVGGKPAASAQFLLNSNSSARAI